MATYTPPEQRPTIPMRAKRPAPAVAADQPQNPWLEFLDRYARDPVMFVREALGGDPHPNQIELLQAYQRGDRFIAMRSGHRVGKTTTLAWIILHQMVCRFPQKTVCTAPTTKQLFEALYAETVTWFRRLKPEVQNLYEVKSEEIVLKASTTESFVSFRTSSAEKPEALAGVHSEYVLLICDEASGIPEPIYEGAIGSMGNPHATQILAGNPVRRSGLFYDVFHKAVLREKWTLFHVSSKGHPNVDQALVEEVAARYGESSNAYRVRVLGEFPLVDDDTVIPWELLESALKRDVKPKAVRPIWGLDVAYMGKDANALAKRRGNALEEKVKIWRGADTMKTTGLVKIEWDNTKLSQRPQYIFVDAIGYGAGVADRLREMGLPAIAINVAETAALNDRYADLRSELWFKGRDWLARKDCSLAEDEDLALELALPTWEPNSRGVAKVEAKKMMRKRTGQPSPNRADAFLLTHVQEAAAAMGFTTDVTNSVREPIRREIRGLI